MKEYHVVVQALLFANIRHQERHQKYGDLPYIMHCNDVVETLRRFGIVHPLILSAGYLHDTLEDTNTTFAEIEVQFGTIVANIVEKVTDKMPGAPRGVRHAATYPELRKSSAARLVKLADRISNVECSLDEEDAQRANCNMSPSSKQPQIDKYRNEYPAFRAFLRSDQARPLIENNMWDYLDGLMDWTSEQEAA